MEMVTSCLFLKPVVRTLLKIGIGYDRLCDLESMIEINQNFDCLELY